MGFHVISLSSAGSAVPGYATVKWLNESVTDRRKYAVNLQMRKLWLHGYVAMRLRDDMATLGYGYIGLRVHAATGL